MWLQVMGGSYMHSIGAEQGTKGRRGGTLSDLFDAMQKAAAHSCSDASRTYRR
jgi:hypothetical protein